MNAVNPKYVLRNYLAQQAIDRAEQGDYSMIEALQTLLQRPMTNNPNTKRSPPNAPIGHGTVRAVRCCREVREVAVLPGQSLNLSTRT